MNKPTNYRSDAHVVWCPGCGHFGVMGALGKALKELAVPKENIAMISGIGCSSRIPGYFDVYGFNTVHGRALPIAQGVKLARPELTVIAACGDGDGLAIGAGHFMHAGRRNVDMTMILMDNQVYGLTKGQASPTTPKGDRMKLAVYGVPEPPLQPISLAITLGATFVARGFSGDPKQLKKLLVAAIQHRGFSVVQVLTPCVTFRKKWDPFKTIREKRTELPEDYDPTAKYRAMELSEREDALHLGVFYQVTDEPTFGDGQNRIADVASQGDLPRVDAVLNDFIQ